MKYLISILFFISAAAAGFSLPGEWHELNLAPNQSLWASSSLTETIRGKKVIYGPEALFDGNYNTPWVEGVQGSGIGEGLSILTLRKITGLSIVNGFALSERLFNRNNRVKSFSISFIAGLTAPGLISENDYSLYFIREEDFPTSFKVADSMDMQYIPLHETEELQARLYNDTVRLFAQDHPDLFAMIVEETGGDSPDLIMEFYGLYAIRITIRDVYRGTHYDDTCISEIELGLEDF